MSRDSDERRPTAAGQSAAATVIPYASPGTAGNYKWLVVFMLWFICFFNYADRQAISSVLKRLESEFGFDKDKQGLIGSAFMWVYAFGAPLAGYIGDRVRRKDLILGGCLFWSFITITTGWCSQLWQFVTVRALEGFGETFYFPASMSLISDYHGKRTRSRAMSFHQSSVYAGTIAGGWFAGWIASKYDWRLGFYVFGGGGMLLALCLYLFLREPRRGAADALDIGVVESVPEKPLSLRETTLEIVRKPTVVLLMLGFLGANLVAGIFLVWAPTFLTDKFHFDLAMAGLGGAVFINAASALSVPFGGLLADRFARHLPGGRILVQAIGLCTGAGFVFLVGHTDDQTTLIVAMSLFGLCKGLYDANIFASMYDAIEPRARASAAGLMNTVGWVGGAIGTMIFGWLAIHGSNLVTNARGSEEADKLAKVANMSESIQWLGAVYIVSAILLFVAALAFARQDVLHVIEKERSAAGE